MANITPDQARVRAVAVAMTALADFADWSAIRRCFAPRVTVDYSSLWGGGPEQLAGDDLVVQWRSMLPGFDATRHELGDVEVSINGDHAAGSAPITATHLMGGDAWIISGEYRFGFVKADKNWRIESLTLLSKSESGDRQLVERARQRVGSA